MTRKVILKDTNNEELIPYTSLATGAEAGRVRPDNSTIEVNANGVINVKQSGLTTKANVGLDNLNSDGQMIIDSANGTISNCILEIPQNIKLTLENNVLTLKAGSTVALTGYNTYTTRTTTADITKDGWVSQWYSKKVLIFIGATGTWFGYKEVSKVGSGSSLPADNTNYDDFYLTTDYSLYEWSNGAWNALAYSYPLCVIDIDSNGVASFAKDRKGRDIIFNSVGFIGHHAFIYPNVKGLTPQKFNADGTLKSGLRTNTSLAIIEMNQGQYGGYNRVISLVEGNPTNNAGSYIEIDTRADVKNVAWVRQYVKNENVIVAKTPNDISEFLGGLYPPQTPLIEYNYDGTAVTDFTIRQPYDGARYLLTDEIEEQVEQNTSDIATKQNVITGAATSITDNNLTANRALTSNSNGKVDVTTTTTTELNYVHGVTSAIQTQLNAKASIALDNLSTSGQMIIDSANGTISNCILEIPQNIKVTLENNVLTLKSGSTVVNGTSTYQTATSTQDSSTTLTLVQGRYLIFTRISDFPIIVYSLESCVSGNTDSLAGTGIRHIWLDTTNKNVKLVFEDSSSAIRTYPLCVIDVDSNGVASFAKDSNSNDMIFNGAGFIGHHAFVYPNVKALLPDKFNDDKSLKSESYISKSLIIEELVNYRGLNNSSITIPAGDRWSAYREVNTYEDFLAQYPSAFSNTRFYVKNRNKIYVYNTQYGVLENNSIVFAYYTYDGTTVTDFTIRQPYEGARCLLTDEKADDSSVVHNKGDESIAGHKSIVDTIDYENASNPTNYRGRQYQQSSGAFIEGLQNKTDSSWLNYVQFRTNGSVKFSGTALTIPTPTENTTSSTQADTVGARVTMLNALYPVGSVYIGTQATCPLATLIPNSTWQLQNSGLVLQCSDSGHTAGTTISAGLPNITGILGTHSYVGEQWSKDGSITGAFYKDTSLSENHIKDVSGTNNGTYNFGFDASKSNSIYGNSTTVQPPALVVNVWIRTA